MGLPVGVAILPRTVICLQMSTTDGCKVKLHWTASHEYYDQETYYSALLQPDVAAGAPSASTHDATETLDSDFLHSCGAPLHR